MNYIVQGVAPELPLKPFVFCLADAGQPGELYRYLPMKLVTLLLTLTIFMSGCNSRTSMQIHTIDFGDGTSAFASECPLTPFGTAHIVAPDTSDESSSLLNEIHGQWNDLWPKMLSSMQETSKKANLTLKIDDEVICMVEYVDVDVYMGDKADIMIGIRPNENAVPEWHFFIRDSTIVHFQPVF